MLTVFALVCIVADVRPSQIAIKPKQYHLLSQCKATKIYGNTYTLTVLFSNRTKAQLLLDTGCDDSFISEDIAVKATLKRLPLATIDDQSIFICKTNTMIKLGDWQAPCSLGIVPNSVMDVFQGEKVDGVLGMNFIKNYAVSFCSQKKQVQFFASSNTTINRQNTYDLSGLGFNAAKAVQMIKGEDNLYSIEAILNGTIKCGFIIDSGAYMSQLSKRCAMQLGLPLDGVTRQQSFLFGEVFLLNGKLKEILVGQTKIAEVIVDYPKTDPSDSLPPLLGMDIFNRYRMFWDFPNSLMYMEKYSKK